MMSRHWCYIIMTGLLVSTAAGCAKDRPARSGPAQQTESPAHASDMVAGRTASEQTMFSAFTRQESEFRNHYEKEFAQTGYAYSQFRPAYQRGFELGYDPHYRDSDWTIIEKEARRNWDESAMGQWDRYKDAVRFGWERGVVAARG
jgi:hypothetical protein